MIRKAEQQLLKWKNSIKRKPLLINGARQVGKTFLVEKIFAPKYFNKFIEIDLRADSQSRKFIKNHPNAKEILNYLSLRFNTAIDSDTLIFFDEIQEAVQILTACKYFEQDYPEIPIIMAGSLVRIRLKQLELESEDNNIKFDVEIEKENQDGHNNFLYPVGKLDKLDMYPLTYDEFLDSYNPSLATLLKKSLKDKTPLNESYHQLALESFYIYLQVGGMPDAVSTYLTTSSVNEAQRIIRNIFSDYLADMSLYQISSQTIVRTKMVFNSIYDQLDKENKNFKISKIEYGKRFRDYLSPFDWLTLARLIYKSNCLKERVSNPLKAKADSLFRVYLPDCGLFACESRINFATFIDSYNQNNLSSVFAENFVAEELASRQIPLFYWKGKTSSEFEFLITIGNEIVPLDVKKTKGSLDSLKVYKNFNSCHLAIKVSKNKYGFSEENNILTIPFFLFPYYLNELLDSGQIQPVIE